MPPIISETLKASKPIRVRLKSLWRRKSSGELVTVWTSHRSWIRLWPEAGGLRELTREEFLRDYESAEEASLASETIVVSGQ